MSDSLPTETGAVGGASSAGDQGSPAATPTPLRTGVVFISHEKSDEGLAREIRAHLERGGLECWMAPDDIRGPTPWPQQVEQAIATCDVMLVVVSANSGSSHHVSREVDLAVERSKPLLPVRIEDVVPTGTLNYLLRLSQWIDLFPGAIADHAGALQSMVGSMLAERGISAPAPIPQKRKRRLRMPRKVLAGMGAVALVAAGVGIGLSLSGDNTPADILTEEPFGGTGAEATAEEGNGQPAPVGSGKGTISRISVASDGTESNGHSVNPVISADGRYVVFDSLGDNLVEHDSGRWRDVFRHDRETGETIRISEIRTPQDRFVEEAFGSSRDARISADGEFIVFVSDAPNIVYGGDDTNDASDIFLWNRADFSITLISRAPDGSQHSLNSIDPRISADGTLIAYATYAGDRTPGHEEIEYFSAGTGDAPLGPYSAWVLDIAGHAPHEYTDVAIGATTTLMTRFDVGDFHGLTPLAVAADGSTVVISGGLGGPRVFDRVSGEVSEIGELRGLVGNGMIVSADGNRLFFDSWSDSLVPDDLNGSTDLFVYDRTEGTIQMLLEDPEPGNGPPPLATSDSADGACLAFMHVGGEWGGALCDGNLLRVGSKERGITGFNIDHEGLWATFASGSSDLVPGDGNNVRDVFVIQLQD